MAGVIAVVRASGRGRRGWELLALLMTACAPTLLMCLTFFFHPEDVLAMGLILAGVACTLRRHWYWAGVLLGLACCAQPFGLLVGASLIFAAQGRDRLRYLVGAGVTCALIDVPFIVATSGRALRTILLGSSRVGIINRSTGGTVLWEADLHGPLLFLISRVAPIVVSMALAWWASRRLGARLLSPVPLVSLVATSVATRLVFEENLFGYYFMAISVALIVLEVVRGRVRGTVFAWIAMVTVAFNPVHEGIFSNLTGHTLDLFYAVPIVVYCVVVFAVLYDAWRRRLRVYKVVWLLVAGLTSESKLWGMSHDIYSAPHWLWQVILVPIALGLAVKPLLAAVSAAGTSVGLDSLNSVTSI